MALASIGPASYFFFCPILLSVPFRNRSIFPLCFIAISPLTVREKSMNDIDGWISAAMTGKSPKAVSAPPEKWHHRATNKSLYLSNHTRAENALNS